MRRHPVVVFYVLAFAISWLGFIPVLAGLRNPLWKIGVILPGCGPALAALIASRCCGRGERIRWVPRNVASGWYALAVALPAAILVAAQLLSRAVVLDQPAAVPPGSMADILGSALMSVAANPWEEVGWRGFATTRLQQRYSELTTAMIVGVLWALWHIPLFLWPESPMSKFPFEWWALALIAEAYVLAWVFNRAGQSLAIAILFHLTMNIAGAAIGIHSFGVLAVVYWMVAVGLAMYTRWRQ